MAQELEKIEFKSSLVDSFRSVKFTGERIVGLIQAAKQTVTFDKNSITNSDLLTADEKTEMKAEYTSRLAKVKTDIENALNT